MWPFGDSVSDKSLGDLVTGGSSAAPWEADPIVQFGSGGPQDAPRSSGGATVQIRDFSQPPLPGGGLPAAPWEADPIVTPSSGLTIAPKGGTPRMGSQADVADQKIIDKFLPLNSPSYTPTPGQARQRGFENVLMNSVVGLPQLPHEVASLPWTIPETVAGWVGADETAQAIASNREGNKALSKYEVPDALKFSSSDVRALPGLLSGEFGDERSKAYAKTQSYEQKRPWNSFLGSGVGTLATLALTKKPYLSTARDMETMALRGIEDAKKAKKLIVERGIKSTETPKDVAGKVGGGWGQISPVLQIIKRGTPRQVESAIEGAYVGIQNEADPAQVAAMAAGQQAVASGAAMLAPPKFGAGFMGKFAAKVLPTFIALAAFDHMTGDPNVFKNWDSTWKKLLLAGTVGVVGKGAGGRWRTGSWGQKRPMLIDTMMSTPRNVSQAYFASYQKASPEERMRVKQNAKTLLEDPSAYSAETLSGLDKYLQTDGAKYFNQLLRLNQ